MYLIGSVDETNDHPRSFDLFLRDFAAEGSFFRWNLNAVLTVKLTEANPRRSGGECVKGGFMNSHRASESGSSRSPLSEAPVGLTALFLAAALTGSHAAG